MEKLKTKKEIAYELGISTKSLYRWLKAQNLYIPRGLISDADQKEIKLRVTSSKLS